MCIVRLSIRRQLLVKRKIENIQMDWSKKKLWNGEKWKSNMWNNIFFQIHLKFSFFIWPSAIETITKVYSSFYYPFIGTKTSVRKLTFQCIPTQCMTPVKQVLPRWCWSENQWQNANLSNILFAHFSAPVHEDPMWPQGMHFSSTQKTWSGSYKVYTSCSSDRAAHDLFFSLNFVIQMEQDEFYIFM